VTFVVSYHFASDHEGVEGRVSTQIAAPEDPRLLPSGDESGTAPGDRRYRPDVEGLRAVAVLLVVLFHAHVPGITGGFIGVDVFFVISGFVITGLLLRENKTTGGTSILNFYARRCRRILPAATLVILVTALFTYICLGVVSGNQTADDGRWAAVFLANFHFEAVGTDYFAALRPPSPLQNFWSLSVEEQFYVVYPSLFLILSRFKGRLALRTRLFYALVPVIALSFLWSIIQTSANPSAAYFSPLTRSWELGLGALVAVSTQWLMSVPDFLARLLTWVGSAFIIIAAFTITENSAYPGSLVALPVVGTALIIAGGMSTYKGGAESILSLPPFQWLGKRSYSLYLWHWPLLIIAAERVGRTTLSLRNNLLLVAMALLLSMITYRCIENPIRHARIPSTSTVYAGLALVLATVAVLTVTIVAKTSAFAGSEVQAPSESVILQEVATAPTITTIPPNLKPPLDRTFQDFVGYGGFETYKCSGTSSYVVSPVISDATEPICTIGDPSGKRLMVLYGDSHALMWVPALDKIAKKAHWRLIVLARYYCPAELVTVADPPGHGPTGAPFVVCSQWHNWAVRTIDHLTTDRVIISQENRYRPADSAGSMTNIFSRMAWGNGLVSLIQSLRIPRSHIVFLGNIPILPNDPPVCLSQHTADVAACSAPYRHTGTGFNSIERHVVTASHAEFIDPTPWFCSNVCTAIVQHVGVYRDQLHMTGTYAKHLSVALGDRLAAIPQNGP